MSKVVRHPDRIILYTTRTESPTALDLPYQPPTYTAVLAVDNEDNLKFVCFDETYIHPDKEHDNHINELLDRAKARVDLDFKERQDIITGTFFDRHCGRELFGLNAHGAQVLLQHPLLRTAARKDLLGLFYRRSTFLCNFDFGTGEDDEPILARALRNLGPTRSSELFAPASKPAVHLALTFFNLNSLITIHELYQWVSLFLDGPLSPDQLQPPGQYDNWAFNDLYNREPSARESALQYFVVGLQEAGRKLGRRPAVQRGDWRKVILQWLADYDNTADWKAEGDNHTRGKMVVGQLTKHRFQRLAKKECSNMRFSCWEPSQDMCFINAVSLVFQSLLPINSRLPSHASFPGFLPTPPSFPPCLHHRLR